MRPSPRWPRWASLAAPLLVLSGCPAARQAPAPGPPSAPVAGASASEVEVRELLLAPPCDDRKAEFSGLAWHGDALVFLPQYPARWRAAPPALWWVSKQTLLAHLDDPAPGPLGLRALPLELNGVPEAVSGYQGFEAIAFCGDEAWLAIECDAQGYVVRGRVSPGRARLSLDPASLCAVPYPRRMHNMGFESLVVGDGGVLALFEANGAGLDRFGERGAAWLGADGQDPAAVGVEALEFRVTDATALDAEGRFWVANYFYASDTDLACQRDPLRPGPLVTHDRFPWVERLVELELSRVDGATEVRRSGRLPVWLALADDKGRNWEGIARLDDRGVLLVTDKYPGSVLAFVPLPR